MALKELCKGVGSEAIKAIPVLLIIFGVASLCLGYFITFSPESKLNALFSAIGTALISAGAFSAFVKSEIFLNVFRDQLQEILAGQLFTDRMNIILCGDLLRSNLQSSIIQAIYDNIDILKQRSDLEEICKRATKALVWRRLPLLDEILANNWVDKFLTLENTYYIKDLSLDMTISWADKEKKIIKIEEENNFSIIPRNEDEILITYQYATELVQDHPLFECRSLKIDNVDKMEFIKITEEEGKVSALAEIPVRGSRKYHLNRHTIRHLPLTIEPYSSWQPTRFVHGVLVRVNCLENLGVVFLTMGNFGEFKDLVNPNPQKISKRFNDLIFPNQGFILFFREIL